MSIGLYDADMVEYTHTAPNLELMKMAAYYRQKREITVMSPLFQPDKFTTFYFRKDYDDGRYPRKLRDFNNVEKGGYAFSRDKYSPLPIEIEKTIPDTTIYNTMKKQFCTNKKNERIFTTCLNSQHLRLSLDEKNIWNDFSKQLSIIKNQNFFFHDRNLEKIKDAPEIIKELVNKNTTMLMFGYISTKFPINIYSEKELMRWLDLKWSGNFFTINYYGLMDMDFFKELLTRTKGTAKLNNIQYFVNYGFKDQQDFVLNGSEKIYEQLILACSNRQKILLKYTDNFFQDKNWERVIKLWNGYNRNICGLRVSDYNYFFNTMTLKKFCSSLRKTHNYNYEFNIQDARDLFMFVKDEHYPLFCQFYEKGLNNKWRLDNE